MPLPQNILCCLEKESQMEHRKLPSSLEMSFSSIDRSSGSLDKIQFPSFNLRPGTQSILVMYVCRIPRDYSFPWSSGDCNPQNSLIHSACLPVTLSDQPLFLPLPFPPTTSTHTQYLFVSSLYSQAFL